MPRLAPRAALVSSIATLALALVACSGGTGPAADPTAAADPPAPPSSAASVDDPPPASAATPEGALAPPPSFGVAECDHYAALACSCSNTLLRSSLCEGLRTSFAAWSSALRTSPLDRDAIVVACTGSERALVTACPDTAVTVTADTAAAATAVEVARDAPLPGRWDGRAPYECPSGNVMLSGVTASVPGESAIYAAGSCHLTLIDMNVTGDIAVEAAGMAEVTIVRGTFTGSRAAVHAGGMSHVTATGASFSGGLERVGEAVVTGVP